MAIELSPCGVMSYNVERCDKEISTHKEYLVSLKEKIEEVHADIERAEKRRQQFLDAFEILHKNSNYNPQTDQMELKGQ